MKNALTLPENEFPAWVKVGAISTPSSFSTRRDLGKGFLRLRHDVQRIGHDHHIEGFVRIGQAEHILHGKVQLRTSRLSRFASAIISAEASVASMCVAALTMCFAISPVPVASSSTVLRRHRRAG